MAMIEQRYIDRFHQLYSIDANTGCWNWTGGGNQYGYGGMNLYHKKMGAHRFSWTIHRGEIPEGLYVCHHCDNPGCVNPDHLFVGTQADNIRDASDKGRLVGRQGDVSGENNNNSKLTPNDVLRIRMLLDGGWKQRDLGKLFGVCKSTIGNIATAKSWKHRLAS